MGHIIKSIDCPDETFKAGEVLFKEGDEGNCFYILKKGKVSIHKDYPNTKGSPIAVIEEGHVFGEIAAFDHLPRTATAVAAEDIETVKVSSHTLGFQLNQCPVWFRSIITELVARLRKTDEVLRANGIDNTHSHSSLQATNEKTSEADKKDEK